jgi:hypothetical protein
VFIHNHPSGDVKESGPDQEVTQFMYHTFQDRFAGHVILDHGRFNLYTPGQPWKQIGVAGYRTDPLEIANSNKAFGVSLRHGLTREKAELLTCALQVDGKDRWNTQDWTPVFFTDFNGITRALHFYGNREFFQINAAARIVEKTRGIARSTGSVWAFPVTDNPAVLPPIKSITKKTKIFRDYYIQGHTGYELRLGGSIYADVGYSPQTDYETTFPLPEMQGRKDMAAAEARDSAKERPMNTPQTYSNNLSREQHEALVEFFRYGCYCDSPSDFKAYYQNLIQIPELQFLNRMVPRQGNQNWNTYRKQLATLHHTEALRYTKRFPDSPSPLYGSTMLSLAEQGDRTAVNPLDFFEDAERVVSTKEYRRLWEQYSSLQKGTIRAISPLKLALFQDDHLLPLLLTDNLPENWAHLYTIANDNGIAVNKSIPTADEVDSLGLGIVRAAEERLRNNMSEQWQREEWRKNCARSESLAIPGEGPPYTDSIRLHKTFTENPYTAGTAVPPFAIQDAGELKYCQGYHFKRFSEDARSVILSKSAGSGKQDSITLSSSFYREMIKNSRLLLDRKEPSKEAAADFRRMTEKDAETTRSNTAVNFWHNYKILCRSQASNPREAMEVAKAIVRQMPEKERGKFKSVIKSYERSTRKLTGNPLLRPFVNPQETYNQRILNYYEQSVADLPIKNRTAHSVEALPSIRLGIETVDTPGKAVAPNLKLRIGDTVKLSLDCKTLFGEHRKQLPVSAFTVVSTCADLNKIVLMDASGRSKYTLALDEFTGKMRKLEKKLEQKQRRLDREESIRY